jgi:predicted enzyme related to lactoylglutathione lyase
MDVVNFHGHFVWYELITTNVEPAKAFYTGVMGWGVRDASTPWRTYILFAAGMRGCANTGVCDGATGERSS